MDNVNKETSRLMMEMALETMMFQAPAIKEYQSFAAHMQFNYFKELLNAGFTEEQAIRIIQSHGFMPKAGAGGTE